MTEQLRPRAPKRGRLTRRQRKVFAFVGAAAVLGIGVTASLAAWTGNQWVYGGTGNGSNGNAAIGTSTFEVQQNTTFSTADGSGGTWNSHTTNDTTGAPAGQLTFTAGALNLTPGTSTYAPVALRTEAGSVAGTVTKIDGAVAAGNVTVNDASNLLWNNLTVSIAADSVPFTCDASAFNGTSTAATKPSVVLAGQSLATATTLPTSATATTANPVETLAAGADSTTAGAPEYYCFDVSLPSEAALTNAGVDLSALMGRSVAPAWNFEYTSN